MRTALTFVLIAIATACGGDGVAGDEDPTATTSSPPTIVDSGFDGNPANDDPNAPCPAECPSGSWCSFGRCVMP
jgi:hypothetical protein